MRADPAAMVAPTTVYATVGTAREEPVAMVAPVTVRSIGEGAVTDEPAEMVAPTTVYATVGAVMATVLDI